MNKWSLKSKIFFILGIFIAASISIAVLGLGKMKEINDSLKAIVNNSSVRVSNIYQLKALFLIQIINEKNLIMADDQESMKIMSDRLAKRDGELKELVEENKKIASEVGKEKMKVFLDLYSKWFALTMEEKELVLAEKRKAAEEVSTGKGRAIRLEVEELLDERVTSLQKAMTQDAHLAEEDYISARNMVLTISVVAILVGLALAMYIMNALCKSIDQVIDNLTDSSNQVTSAAQQIASSSEELSQAASEQASSLEETSSSIEEMNSMVKKNADNAKRTADISTQSSDSAVKGKMVVSDMIKAIDEISQSNTTIMHQVDVSNEQISDIVKVIAEIEDKTKVINDIVFQTKLLSFNASVEAARAGEHGKGFAVVAEEVGSLAQMSGNAAQEISSMLEASSRKVESIVEETKRKVGSIVLDGKSKIENGIKVARQCGEVLDEIVENVSSVKDMANEIATACNDQAQGVQEITRAINQLDQVTQTNAATSEEAASSAEELSSQAEFLRSTVGILSKNINGDDGKGGSGSTADFVSVRTKRATSTSNVVPINRKPRVPNKELRKVAGLETSTPSENDPRFKDI